MKAIVQNGYGSPEVLKLKEVAKPEIKDNEVLVRVHASSVNAGDLFSMRGTPYMVRFSVGFPKPKDFILGWDFAGRVEGVGKNVKQFKIGDEVFGTCPGAFAEYVRVDAENLAMKPSNLTFEQTAAVPTAAITALQRLRDGGEIRKGHKVLIMGASGGVGSFAVQIAKTFGAEVTGVCSTGKMEMVRLAGADHVIDYKKNDFTKGIERFDFILDNVGNHTFSDLKKVLTPKGKIIPNTGHAGMGYVIKAFALAPFSRNIVGMKIADPNSKDLSFLKDLIESEKVTPIIDRIYPLKDTPEAMKYLESGQVKGKVIIKVVNE